MHTNHIRNMEALFSPLSATSPSPPAAARGARISSPPPAVHAAAARMLREAESRTTAHQPHLDAPDDDYDPLARRRAALPDANSVLANEDLLLLIIHHCIGADALHVQHGGDESDARVAAVGERCSAG